MAAGADVQDMWAELEGLNLGRLRIAAKGLVREGDALIEVDDEARRREGMFMIGAGRGAARRARRRSRRCTAT